MRKPRDFDAELQQLSDKARQLRQRKVQQLGELVIACGADALPLECLAGALLASTEAEPGVREAWRQRGAGLFQRGADLRSPARGNHGRTTPPSGDAPPPAGADRARRDQGLADEAP